FFFFQAEDGIRDRTVTGVQTCALPILFQLLGDWPVNGGAMVVPVGTILEWEADAESARLAGVPTTPQWRGQALPLPMPLNARARSEERRVGKECEDRRGTEP